MTNKERLDAIKGRAMFNQLAKRTGEITHSLVTLDEEDYDWLIEQAERVQELEETVEDYKTVNKELHQRGRKVRKQNKRYREALEFYADRDNYKLEHFDPNINDYMSTVDYDEGQKARQTIESEKIND